MPLTEADKSMLDFLRGQGEFVPTWEIPDTHPSHADFKWMGKVGSMWALIQEGVVETNISKKGGIRLRALTESSIPTAKSPIQPEGLTHSQSIVMEILSSSTEGSVMHGQITSKMLCSLYQDEVDVAIIALLKAGNIEIDRNRPENIYFSLTKEQN